MTFFCVTLNSGETSIFPSGYSYGEEQAAISVVFAL